MNLLCFLSSKAGSGKMQAVSLGVTVAAASFKASSPQRCVQNAFSAVAATIGSCCLPTPFILANDDTCAGPSDSNEVRSATVR